MSVLYNKWPTIKMVSVSTATISASGPKNKTAIGIAPAEIICTWEWRMQQSGQSTLHFFSHLFALFRERFVRYNKHPIARIDVSKETVNRRRSLDRPVQRDPYVFFISFPIDVVMLNRDKEVIKTITHLKPWKIAPPVRHAYSTLEWPAGAIQKYDIQLGDTVTFNYFLT